MSSKPQDNKPSPTIRDLYPSLSEQEAIEAEENLTRYIQLALQIYERIREDPELYAKFRHLTASKSHPSMHNTNVEPSNNQNSSSKE
jgi:hypothetical protein